MTTPEIPALASTQWLAGRLGDQSIRIAEIRMEPGEPEPARIPGAMSWFWKDIFWDPLSREFATPALAAQRLSAHGVPEGATLVLYSDRVQFSAYGHWALTQLCGQPGVRVLDGGWRKWRAEGRPLGAGPAAPPAAAGPRPAQAARDDSTRVYRDEVVARIGREGTVILDARSAEEYAGLRVRPAPGYDHGAERAGRIPGAVHLPAAGLLGADGAFRPKGEIEQIFRDAGAAPGQADEVIAYCRLGHRASMLWFAAHHILGWEHVRVYDGSWTEWGSSVAMPVEREAAPAN